MDDSLIIYSSIFLLASFTILFKFFKLNLVIALGIPLVLIFLYINLNNLNSKASIENFELITELPTF